MAREFAIKFYKSKGWKNAREFALMRDNYLCVECGRPAEEVHHIIHLTPENITDPNITLNASNLKCLCKDCHFAEHLQDKIDGKRKANGLDYNYEFDENGMLVEKHSPPV